MTDRSVKRKIIVDFDGTICGFAFPDCGPPEPGVKNALAELQKDGWEIVIHSCRTATYWDSKEDFPNKIYHTKLMKEYLSEYDIPYDSILLDNTADKPFAFFYIDDRAISYKGDWVSVLNEIKERSSENC